MSTREKKLRKVIEKMDADSYVAIRRAYYKAVEGLHSLANTLELVDLDMGSPEDCVLIEEHLLACGAIEAMKDSKLGRVL